MYGLHLSLQIITGCNNIKREEKPLNLANELVNAFNTEQFFIVEPGFKTNVIHNTQGGRLGMIPLRNESFKFFFVRSF